MKKTLVIVILSVLIISFTGLTSCKSKPASQEQKEIQKIIPEIKKNVYPIPNSAYVINMLAEYGVSYLNEISNPAENVKKYLIRSKQAQNLGAFGADLSYATLYNNQQEVMNYLGVIRTLANELKMPKIYDESLYEKIKVNFDKRDTLVKILTDAFNSTYAYLSDNDQQVQGLLVVGGAWIEGMHLITHVSSAAYNTAAVVKVLLEQKKSFEIYLDITKPYLSDPDLSEFIKLLDPMKQVYAGLTTSLTAKDVNDITRAIEGIRKQVVQ